MTQGLERRMRYMERSHGKAPLPWLKHKLYLARLWTGAYMLDTWETALLTAIILAVLYYTYSLIFGTVVLIADTDLELEPAAEQ